MAKEGDLGVDHIHERVYGGHGADQFYSLLAVGEAVGFHGGGAGVLLADSGGD